MKSEMGRRRIPKQGIELISNEKARHVTFQKRRKCLEKKAYELSTLCGVEACVIVYGPKLKDQHRPIDQPEIWPKDPDAIRRMFISYKERSDEDRCKRTLDFSDLFEDDPKKKKKKAEKTKYPTWDDSYNGLSEEQLRVFGTILEEKLEAVKTRVQFLKGNYPELAGSTMMDSFLATHATTQNHSYFLQSDQEAIHDHQHQQQPPISLVNLQRDLDMPVYYLPLDLSMPNSMMKMEDKDCNIIGLGDASIATSNVEYSTTTNSSVFYDSTSCILENVIMDNLMSPQMSYYEQTLQPPSMLSSMPNLMTMMMMNMDDTDDCIGLSAGVSGSNFTHNNTLDPIYDPMSGTLVENVIMGNHHCLLRCATTVPVNMQPMSTPDMNYPVISRVPSYMHASF